MRLKDEMGKVQVICREYKNNKVTRTLSFIVYDTDAETLRRFLAAAVRKVNG